MYGYTYVVYVSSSQASSTKIQMFQRQTEQSPNDEFRTYCKSPEEIKKVYALHRLTPTIDHCTVLRFLRARKGVVEDATTMLQEYCEWRERTFPIELTDNIKKELSKGKYYCRGRDKDGHIVLLCKLRLLPRGSYESFEIAVNAMLWAFEWVSNSQLLKSPMDTWTILIDARQIPYLQFDQQFVKQFADVLQKRYPEKLHRMVVFPAGTVVKLCWSAVKIFFDPNTVAKVEFCRYVCILLLVCLHYMYVNYLML